MCSKATGKIPEHDDIASMRSATRSYRYNGKWLPSWLQEAGYQTYYTGKLMNGNNIVNAVTRPTAGFNGKNHALFVTCDHA
jgi:arylsulfatase A-like enzyme